MNYSRALPFSLQQFLDGDEELRAVVSSRPLFVQALLEVSDQADQLETARATYAAAQSEDLPELLQRMYRAGQVLQTLASTVAALLDDQASTDTEVIKGERTWVM